MLVPCAKYPLGPRSTKPSVSKFAILAGPRPAFCVDVKPRNSSAVSGIRSAPGTPAAVAICFGRLFEPWNPPPTNPLRMLVTRKMSARSVEQRLRAVLDVRRGGRCEAGRRHGSPRAACRAGRSGSGSRRPARARSSSAAAVARLSTGRWRAAWRGHVAVEVRHAPGDRDAEPGRRPVVARLELAGSRPRRPRPRLRQVDRPRLDAKRGRDDLVVKRRHEDLDVVVDDDARSRPAGAARAAPVPRRAGDGESASLSTSS